MPGSSASGWPIPLDADPLADGALAIRNLVTAVEAAWVNASPTLTASTTNPTLGTASQQLGRYKRFGKTILYQGHLQFGTAGVAAGLGVYRISLPVAANVSIPFRRLGLVTTYDASTGGIAQLFANLDNVAGGYFIASYPSAYPVGSSVNLGNSSPMAFAASDQIDWSIMYEAA